jgi:hypothetical protein
MQFFFFFDLALALVALLGYRALSLMVHRVPLVSLKARVTPHRVRGGTPDNIAPMRKPAPPQPLLQEVVTPKCTQRSDQCRSTRHRLINFW